MKTATIEPEVQVRLAAQMFLAETGWRCRTELGLHRAEKVLVYFASHDRYPEQSALSVRDLVKRCTWQEAHRIPKALPVDRERVSDR